LLLLNPWHTRRGCEKEEVTRAMEEEMEQESRGREKSGEKMREGELVSE
jgi:hypothetical protein